MLKKIQRRFILSAMAAFGAVTLALILGINAVNYHQSTKAQDDLAKRLMRYEYRRTERPEEGPPPMPNMPWAGPEAEFTTRFFTVRFDLSGELIGGSREHISSVDGSAAEEYARAVLQKGRQKGYYGDYRYLVSRDERGTVLLFLNASGTLHFMRSLLAVSLLTGAVSLLLVFGLILLFSGYAIRPYAENIRRQKQFITDAGHELKTPITSIATSADIAAMEHEGDEWIENIRKQTSRLSRLVGELVALSRLDEETPFPETAIFSLSEAAWETSEPFAMQAKAEGKTYTQEVEEGLTLRGDRSAVQQLLSILLDNAVRYSTGGGDIRLKIYRKRSRIHMEIQNLCKMPEIPDLNRLFDRFYRPDESRSGHTGGTGVGLALARAIAESHGGRIQAKKLDGRTICFLVVF